MSVRILSKVRILVLWCWTKKCYIWFSLLMISSSWLGLNNVSMRFVKYFHSQNILRPPGVVCIEDSQGSVWKGVAEAAPQMMLKTLVTYIKGE